jgi:hypothetical protein
MDVLRALYDEYDLEGSFRSAELYYHDVNGDGASDLIVVPLPYEGYSEIWQRANILLREGDRYIEALELSGDYSKFAIPSPPTIVFEDWTGDGIPEVILDGVASTSIGVEGSTGGYRIIAHCTKTTCQEVWHNGLWSVGGAYTINGVTLCQTLIRRPSGSPSTFVYLTSAFSFYGIDWVQCGDYGNAMDGVNEMIGETHDFIEIVASLRVLPKYLYTYSWSGSTFEVVNKELYAPAYVVTDTHRLEAKSDSGDIVTIKVQYSPSIILGTYENDTCRLEINSIPIGDSFGCKWNFTQVEWKDLTGDGEAEIVALTTSGPYSYDETPLTQLKLYGERCTHQRLLVYQWDGNSASLAANIEGCVVQENLYGVEIRPAQDGTAAEILAAESPTDSFGNPGIDLVYKWDGRQFVFTERRERR